MNRSQVASGLAIAGMVAVAQCLPLWSAHWFDTHEYYAYVLRVVEFEAAMRQGDPYPRWASDFYGGYGSPFFVFYAPLVFAGGALMSALVGSVVLGLKVWIVLASVAAGTGVYVAVRAETRRPDAALLACLVYLGAPYRLANLYVRGDIAEYTALALLPWACWAYRDVARALPVEIAPRRAALAAALHAALLFSHAITGLWGTLLLGVLCVLTTWQLLRRRAWKHAGLIGAGFALALALASVYIGPALLQKSYVSISIATSDGYQPLGHLLSPRSLLKGQFGILPAAGIALILAGAAACLRRGFGSALTCGFAAAMYAFLSTHYAEHFWGLELPLTSFIQFPWRLHGLAALTAAVALGLAWAALLRVGTWRETTALLLGAAAVLLTARICAVDRPLAKGTFPETASEIRSAIHHTTAHEYLPRWVSAPPTAPPHKLAGGSPQVRVKTSWSHGTSHELELIAVASSTIELALHMFPGWRVTTLSGPAPTRLVTTPDGRVGLSLPKPGNYRVQLNFGPSPARAAFGALSLLALVATWPILRYIARGRAQMGVTPSRRPQAIPALIR